MAIGLVHRCLSWTQKLRTTSHQETCLLSWPEQNPVLKRNIKASLQWDIPPHPLPHPPPPQNHCFSDLTTLSFRDVVQNESDEMYLQNAWSAPALSSAHKHQCPCPLKPLCCYPIPVHHAKGSRNQKVEGSQNDLRRICCGQKERGCGRKEKRNLPLRASCPGFHATSWIFLPT